MKTNPRKAVLIAGLLASGVGMAATETTTINVTANVPGSCSISADPIAFGEVAELGTEVTAAGAVTVNCSTGTTYLVGMDAGQHLLTGFRSMENASDHPISYIIENQNNGQSWGDSGITGGNFTNASSVSGSGDGTDQSLPFTARANGDGQQTGSNVLTAGTSYSDVVTVTVQF